MQKEIKERIINLIQENEQSSRNELVQIAINEIKIPEYEVLADRYVANVIAQTAATIRDEKNRRTV